ncbi:uncharacterized protein PHACADRAFT_263292 [Phanerochaete carnosa HHB-10118-sp]|uniref:Uncharacterized protein n=1 Tax=Phanerochaete carnosa (strain HHB-10118-sp) TaxID=650164 RepID=K5VXB6_PHACS|nr:uncharacterized protein PHACADRAFT_263292 [Phanerochaete carnosa HHB-10118-sp]EKM51249.1 hypothetical protein PHACADRAFT_263292 [Phanerochaete carnosa HHB-10118-sp]
MLAQLITAGVVLPLYFALHICEVPPVPGTRKMYSATRVRMLFPAIALGFLLPSAFLFLFSAGDAASLDRKQIIAAAWQPFPVYVAAVYRLLCGSTSYMPTEASEDTSTQLRTFPHLRNVYMSSGLLSMLAHWAILVPSLLTTDAAYSFVHVFVPYPLHSYLGVTPSTLPSYRLSIRLLFQNDWLTTMVAAFIFFGYIRLDTQKLGNWMLHVAKWTVLGGPGAAMAWAAVDREEHINSVRLNRQFSVRYL